MDSDTDEPDAGAVTSRRQNSHELVEAMEAIAHRQPSRTVLPAPFAKAVTLATRSTCLAIRAGTFISSYGFDAARVTTLSSLELGRGIVEGILSRAGKDMISRTRTDLSRLDAETIIERSLENLHHAMSQVVFWTTTGFHLTGTTLSVFSEISQLLLSSLDQFFGSTDSSRAIASIITLIRREFYTPTTGDASQQVGVVDLVVGMCALAYLQGKCWKLVDEESRRLGHEEIVWDVVVLNDGERVDVHEDSLYGVHKGSYNTPGPDILVSSPVVRPGPDVVASLGCHGEPVSDRSSGDQFSAEDRLRYQIMQSLPPDAVVSISTTTLTQKTITVEFSGPQVPALAPPPGVEIVERELIPTGRLGYTKHQGAREPALTHRVVYRVDESEERRSTICQGGDRDPTSPAAFTSDPESDAYDSDVSMTYAVGQSERQFDGTSSSKQLLASPIVSTALAGRSAEDETPRTTRLTKQGNGIRRSGTPQATPSPENAPNQKRQRTPLAPLPVAKGRQDNSRRSPPVVSPSLPSTEAKAVKRTTSPLIDQVPPQKKTGGLRQALKRGSGSNLPFWGKETASSKNARTDGQPKAAAAAGDRSARKTTPTPSLPSRATGPTTASKMRARNVPDPVRIPRSSSRTSYTTTTVQEHRRGSLVSQTDSYSIHTDEGFPPASPLFPRPDSRSLQGGFFMPPPQDFHEPGSPSSSLHIQRKRPYGQGLGQHAPSRSLYSIAASGSQASLVLSQMHPKSAFTDSEAIDTLRRAGTLEGIFPSFHLLRNVTRFMLYSSASYGSSFLKVVGLAKEMPFGSALKDESHHEIRSFAHHTESHTDSVLLASFVDPQGGSDTTGSTGTGVPLVHYVSLDHESKAVVLACRGTLGFEDVLADLACDYDELRWRGRPYQVHKGIHASARRLLYGGDGRVLYTLREALEEFNDYGLVLCGHSLGGAVTALLGTMLAEPSPTGTGFVTSAEPHRRLLLADGLDTSSQPHVCLPPGRPIHVYAYGPPGTMSPSLRKATRGLITSTIQGNDLVPYLSLGVLHDLQAVALSFKNDGHEAKVEAKQRIWRAFQHGLADKWYASGAAAPPPGLHSGDDEWASTTLTSLRATMTSRKLLPPGEVFVVESSRVLRRDAFVLAGEPGGDLGRPARRVVFKYVRDVEARFREVRFGGSMLLDHSPAKYEEALGKLRLGVTDTG